MTNMRPHAEFVVRKRCIACRSGDLAVLAAGGFHEEPVRGFLEADPWGESPLPYLDGATWELAECRACGQRFHRRLLTPAWQEIRFREWMSGEAIRAFERARGLDRFPARFVKAKEFAGHVLRIERLTRPIRGDGPARVLDFGCGWGEFLSVAAAFGCEALGVERAPDRRQHLAERGVVALPNLDAVHGGVHAVTLFQVLEHLDEPLDILLRLRDVVTPGGVLVIEVPDCTGIRGIRSREDYYNAHPLEHINCFTHATLRKMTQRAGFRAVAPPPAYVAAGAVKAARSTVKWWVHRLRHRGTNQYFRRED